MNILEELNKTDLFVCYGLVILCGLFYLIAGLMLVIKKDTKLINKIDQYHNPEAFCKVYGLVEIVVSTIIIGLAIYGFFNIDHCWVILISSLLLVVTMLLTQVFLQKKYKKK